jgi:hypothetical protein
MARRISRRPKRRRVLIGLSACAGCFFLIAGGVYTKWTAYLRRPPLRLPLERTFEIRPSAPDQLHATLDHLRRDPAVEAATISSVSLGKGGRQLRWLDSREAVCANDVDPTYFAFMGAALLRGRIFSVDEQYSMVVGQRAATKFWPGEDPLGKKLRLHWWDGSSAEYAVVGVVEETGECILTPGPRRAGVFTLLEQGQFKTAVVLARVRPDATATWMEPATPLTNALRPRVGLQHAVLDPHGLQWARRSLPSARSAWRESSGASWCSGRAIWRSV